MFEAIITFVGVESTPPDGGPVVVYPTTKIYRVEFDVESGFERLMSSLFSEDGQRLYDIADVHQLRA